MRLRSLPPQATRYSFLRDIASNTCFLVRKDCCKVHYVLLSPRSPVLKVVKYVVKNLALRIRILQMRRVNFIICASNLLESNKQRKRDFAVSKLIRSEQRKNAIKNSEKCLRR